MKLTGIPCSDDETVPTPQATEWSFVVVVTVTVIVPKPVQVNVCCSLAALATAATTSATSATTESANKRRISPPSVEQHETVARPRTILAGPPADVKPVPAELET